MDDPQTTAEVHPVEMIMIAATPIIGAALIGASTNAVNGFVSPIYFQNIMQWHHVADIWRASIAQGIFEGLLYGILFSIFFTPVIGIVTRARCPFRVGFRYFQAIFAAIYCCWAAGGLIGIGLAALSADFYRSTFYRVPDEFDAMLMYAWVGGSIWGELFGGVLSLILGTILFPQFWRRSQVRNSNATFNS